MSSIVKILIAVLVFSAIILFHELGHFLAAKAVGVGVTEFSLGMGPTLVSWGKGFTKYSIKAIPFGGACMMVGEDEENPAENAFNNKPARARFLVVAAGPCFNFILAFLISMVLIAMDGYNPAIVYRVNAGSGAEAAGLQAGDEILSINGHRIAIGRDIEILLYNHPLDGSAAVVVYRRDGEKHTISYNTRSDTMRIGISYYPDETPLALSAVSAGSPAAEAGLTLGDIITEFDGVAMSCGKDLQDYLGDTELDDSTIHIVYTRDGKSYETDLQPQYIEDLGFSASYFWVDEVTVGDVLIYGAREVRYYIEYSVMSLKMLLTGRVGVRDMSGPVGIVDTIGDVIDEGMETGGIRDAVLNLMIMAILLNANLGLMNLLPLPALDGGRLLFILAEMIVRKRLPEKVEGTIHLVGFVLLMALMVVVMGSDILRLFGK